MSEPRTPLSGHIAQILNSRELVLNIGTAAGVKIGMLFDVLDPKGENIRDPITKRKLGSLSRKKIRVRITDVRDELSVASTFRRKRINVGGTGPDLSNFSRYLLPRQWMIEYETLRAEDRDREELDERESYVKVGDPVIEVVRDKEEETVSAPAD